MQRIIQCFLFRIFSKKPINSEKNSYLHSKKHYKISNLSIHTMVSSKFTEYTFEGRSVNSPPLRWFPNFPNCTFPIWLVKRCYFFLHSWVKMIVKTRNAWSYLRINRIDFVIVTLDDLSLSSPRNVPEVYLSFFRAIDFHDAICAWYDGQHDT